MAKSGGRKKIEMKLIENESARAVTLSKRRNGLFKKASELATLCGVWIATIVFTVSGKPHAFGSPHLANVTQKFLNDNEQDDIQASINSQRKAEVEELNQEFDEVNERSAYDKKIGQNVEKDVKVFLGGNSYDDYKSTLGIDQLQGLRYKLEQLKLALQHRYDEDSSSNEDSSSEEEYEVDLSKIEGPKDFLKL